MLFLQNWTGKSALFISNSSNEGWPDPNFAPRSDGWYVTSLSVPTVAIGEYRNCEIFSTHRRIIRGTNKCESCGFKQKEFLAETKTVEHARQLSASPNKELRKPSSWCFGFTTSMYLNLSWFDRLAVHVSWCEILIVNLLEEVQLFGTTTLSSFLQCLLLCRHEEWQQR